jgi:hypothetical protein
VSKLLVERTAAISQGVLLTFPVVSELDSCIDILLALVETIVGIGHPQIVDEKL